MTNACQLRMVCRGTPSQAFQVRILCKISDELWKYKKSSFGSLGCNRPVNSIVSYGNGIVICPPDSCCLNSYNMLQAGDKSTLPCPADSQWEYRIWSQTVISSRDSTVIRKPSISKNSWNIIPGIKLSEAQPRPRLPSSMTTKSRFIGFLRLLHTWHRSFCPYPGTRL